MAEEPPMLSIVMATYNMRRDYLKQALYSTLNQTAPERTYEVIVVGLIEDENWAWLTDFASKHSNVRLVESDRADVYHQRNLGLQASDAQFMAFFDSDDFMLPNKVTGELQLALANRADIIYSAFFYADEQLCIRNPHPVQAINKLEMISRSMIPDVALFSRKLYKRLGGLNVEKFRTACVYDFWLRALLYPDTRGGPYPYYAWLYRQRADSLGHRLGGQEIRDRERAVDAYRKVLGIEGPPTKMQIVSLNLDGRGEVK